MTQQDLLIAILKNFLPDNITLSIDNLRATAIVKAGDYYIGVLAIPLRLNNRFVFNTLGSNTNKELVESVLKAVYKTNEVLSGVL